MKLFLQFFIFLCFTLSSAYAMDGKTEGKNQQHAKLGPHINNILNTVVKRFFLEHPWQVNFISHSDLFQLLIDKINQKHWASVAFSPEEVKRLKDVFQKYLEQKFSMEKVSPSEKSVSKLGPFIQNILKNILNICFEINPHMREIMDSDTLLNLFMGKIEQKHWSSIDTDFNSIENLKMSFKRKIDEEFSIYPNYIPIFHKEITTYVNKKYFSINEDNAAEDPSDDNTMTIDLAVMRGDLEQIKKLVEEGIDISSIESDSLERMMDGGVVEKTKILEISEYLLTHGYPGLQRYDGFMMVAAINNRPDLLEIIFDPESTLGTVINGSWEKFSVFIDCYCKAIRIGRIEHSDETVKWLINLSQNKKMSVEARAKIDEAIS